LHKARKNGAPRSTKVTIEEVEDEEHTTAKKKKKKKPKKKRASLSIVNHAETIDNDQQPVQSPRPITPPSVTTPLLSSPQGVASPTKSSAKKKKKKKSGQDVESPSSPRSNTAAPSMYSAASSATIPMANASTASIPLYRSQTAQSSHSYVKQQGLDEKKEKIKSRPDPGSLQPISEKNKSIFSRFANKKVKEESNTEAKASWFSNLTKKTTVYMHQLLRTSEDEKQGQAGMKWEHFVKVRTQWTTHVSRIDCFVL
jgi:hypothetical protein